jgi:hypothetical protein
MSATLKAIDTAPDGEALICGNTVSSESRTLVLNSELRSLRG